MVTHLVNLLFPEVCSGCGVPLIRGEQHICTSCLSSLPLTGFATWPDNPVAKRLWGRVNAESAGAYMYFVKNGIVQQLLHNLKYKGQREVGTLLGKLYGGEMADSGMLGDLDMVLPVPMFKPKERRRGYNQAEAIATGMAGRLELPLVTDILVKIVDTGSQTRLNRWMRWENQQEIFALKNPDKAKNKHLLLVDDVITTGATLEACISLLNKVSGCRVSVAALACAA